MKYADGTLGVFDCGFRGQFRVQAKVVGTEGALIVVEPYIMRPPCRLVVRRGDEEQEVTLPAADPYRCEVEALTAAVLDGAALAVPLSNSRANVATLQALYRAARQGRYQPVKAQSRTTVEGWA